MVHIIASFAFSVIALGAIAILLETLAEGREKILRALGATDATPHLASPRPARIRPAGRWQATPGRQSVRRAVA